MDPRVGNSIIVMLRRFTADRPSRGAVLVALLLGVAPAGCGQKMERAENAAALPVAVRDPLEDSAAQKNWPEWRGERSSGISASDHIPTEWTSDRNIRWKKAVPGRGNSSPIVWGDQVLLTSAVDDVSPPRLVVLSFHRQTGALQWETEAGRARGDTHSKNGYASASVATDGRQVFAFFGGTGLLALDLVTGQKQWSKNVGALEHQWGTASSPVLVGNLVIQLCDAATDSALVAFDKSTGQRVWRTPRDSNGCWSTPVLVDTFDAAGRPRQELVVNGTGTDAAAGGYVIAYDPTDGHELWRVQGTTEVVCPTAIFSEGLVISTSGRNGPIIAIRPGGSGDVTHSHVVWKNFRGGPYVPTGVAYRNRLYTVADGGLIGCHNLGNGDPVWREHLRGNFSASLIAVDGNLYAASEQGTVYVIAAGDTYQSPLAVIDMQERITATPAVASGELFLRTDTRLYCVSSAAAPEGRSLTAAPR